MVPPEQPAGDMGAMPPGGGQPPTQPTPPPLGYTPFVSPSPTPPPPSFDESSFQVGQPATPPRRRRRGLLVASISGGAVVVIVGITLTLWLALGRDTRPETIQGAVTISVRDLRVGDCVDPMPQGPGIEEATVVECSQFHPAQLIASVTLPDEATTQAQIDGAALARCENATAGARERASAQGQELTPTTTYLAPSEESWGRGDRRVDCFVYIPGPGITGSLSN